MLILDIKVLSEIMGPHPAPEVAAWPAYQPDDLAVYNRNLPAGGSLWPGGYA